MRAILLFICLLLNGEVFAADSVVIAASPSLKHVLAELSTGFEQANPGVRVKLYFNTGLGLRQGIAAMENSMVGQYFIGGGPVHLIAPGGDELLARLEAKAYVLPETKRPYAQDQLVLVVPESLVEAPRSLEHMSRGSGRLAVAEPTYTSLGKQTSEALHASGVALALKKRLDEAADSRGVIDHVLSGEAEAGIIYGHEAVRERERLRVVATIQYGYRPTVHSIAMERSCPNRALCERFLDYVQSSEARSIVQQSGYAVPQRNAD